MFWHTLFNGGEMNRFTRRRLLALLGTGGILLACSAEPSTEAERIQGNIKAVASPTPVKPRADIYLEGDEKQLAASVKGLLGRTEKLVINPGEELTIAFPTDSGWESLRLSFEKGGADTWTLVMGGLVNNSARKESKKVPILGDIPGLGNLFRHSNRSKRKSNLLIFITPTIITDDHYAMAKEKYEETRQIEERIMAPERQFDSARPARGAFHPTRFPSGRRVTTCIPDRSSTAFLNAHA